MEFWRDFVLALGGSPLLAALFVVALLPLALLAALIRDLGFDVFHAPAETRTSLRKNFASKIGSITKRTAP